jgi:predicted neuraminidase
LIEADGTVFRVLAGPSGSIQGPAEAKWGYTTLSVADWDGDGRDDILYNSIWPRIQLLRNTKDGLIEEPLPFWTEESPPKWYWWQAKAENLQTQWRTTPLATDFDGDGQLDLVILDQEGYLTCQSRASEDTRIFIDEDNQPIRLNTRSAGRSGRYKLDVIDWDGDGRLDILVNSENASWYRNCEERNGKVVLKKVGNLARRDVAGHTSSPTACDFDKDGKPDLVVGAENGRMYYIKHDDCIQYSAEQIEGRKPADAVYPRFSGFVSEGFIYEKAPFPQCHASTIVETPRGLVSAWFGGTKEKNPDVGIWSSYNDGAGWSSPREWANGIQHENLRHPCWNPVLVQPPGNAPTMLFFKVGPTPRTWWGEVTLSYDYGRSFRDRRKLPSTIDGPVRCKPLFLENGDLLCPSSTEHDNDWRFHFEILTDFLRPELGTSWKRIEPETQPFQVIQPTLLTQSDGSIRALMRSKHEQIAESISTDGARTWSDLKLIDLPNNNSGIEAVTLEDGRHLLLYNHTGGRPDQNDGWGRRNVLNLAVSEDGAKWKEVATIEKEDTGEFSYPAMIQTSDGLIHMTYTWNRQKVKHVVVDPAKLMVGKTLNLDFE